MAIDLQVLVAAMNQEDYSLIDKMNLQSDAIIVNQCDKNEIEQIETKGRKIKFLSLAERGVGLSRNNALMRATADICLFADEDLIYVDGYKEKVIQAFSENPDADVILFNVPSNNSNRPTYIIPKQSRVRWFNCLRYGAVKIAIRTDKIRSANVYFSLLFGGGALYGSGEDSLFIAECIKKGLKVYTNPEIIGYVTQQESSWFQGYTDKYFIDKGAFYRNLSRRWAYILAAQFVIRHRKMFQNEQTCIEALKLMNKGINIK